MYLKKLSLYLRDPKNKKMPKIISCIPYFKSIKHILKYISNIVESNVSILRLITTYSKQGHQETAKSLLYKLFCSIATRDFIDTFYFLTDKIFINFIKDINHSLIIKGIIIPLYLKTRKCNIKGKTTRFLLYTIAQKPRAYISLLVYLLLREFGVSYSFLTRILMLRLCDVIPKYIILHMRWYMKRSIVKNKSSILILRKIFKKI